MFVETIPSIRILLGGGVVPVMALFLDKDVYFYIIYYKRLLKYVSDAVGKLAKIATV